MLEIADLQLVRSGRRLHADGLDLALPPGQALLVAGPNGAGKTTLLRTLAGLQPLHAARLRWGALEGAPAREALCAQGIFVGHRDALHDALTALENLDHALRLSGEARTEAALRRALADAGLAAQADLPARRLSQGQRRRVALARLVLSARPLWLLDEALAGLDTAARDDFIHHRLPRHLAGGGCALLSTHDDPWPASLPRLQLPAPLALAA